MKVKKENKKYYHYTDNISDEELRSNGITLVRRKWWKDKDFMKELKRRTKELESGKVKGIPLEEVHKEIRDMLKIKGDKK